MKWGPAGSAFDTAFQDIDIAAIVKDLNNSGCSTHILARCLVAKDISPRHPNYEFELNMGVGFIEPILHAAPFPIHTHYYFAFPERWMTPWEQQRFMHCIYEHPNAAAFQRVDVLTASPLIVGGFTASQVRVLQNPDLRQKQIDAWGGKGGL